MVQSCFVFFRWSLRARGVMADQANVRCCFGLKSVRCFFYSRLFVAFFPFFFTYASFLESSFIFKWVSFVSWFSFVPSACGCVSCNDFIVQDVMY